MEREEFRKQLSDVTDFPMNDFHPFVWVLGSPKIGEGVYIGAFSAINAKDSSIEIGDSCDIASFVSINCADSHKKCIGLSDEVERKSIRIENNVFIGSHSVIKGGAKIGSHTVVAAGTVVEGKEIPPYSLVSGNPMVVKVGYYKEKLES